MGTGDILRIMLVVIGAGLFVADILSLAAKKLKEQYALVWGMVSLLLVVSGILLRPVTWNTYISPVGTLIVLIIVLCVVYTLFYLSIQTSILSRRNQELAMQVSLLNRENERVIDALERLTSELDMEKIWEEQEKEE